MPQLNKNRVLAKCFLLGVDVNFTLEELKDARNKIVRKYHPDKHPNLTKETEENLTELIKGIHFAYDFLKNNQKEINNIFKNVKLDNGPSKAGPCYYKKVNLYDTVQGFK